MDRKVRQDTFAFLTAFAIYVSRVAEWTKGLDSEFIVYGQQTGGSTGSTGTTGTKNTQSDGRATYHIFPQLAYGTFTDGSFYQSMLYINNPVGGSTANCTIVAGRRTSSVTFQPGQWNLYPYTSSSPPVSGFLSVSCNTQVFATLLYSYNSSAGKTIGEATVFSSPVSTNLHIVADQREGKRLGLAIANDTDAAQTATITVWDTQATLLKSVARRLAARSSIAAFLDDLTGYNGTTLAQITVACDTGCAAIGLRFADSVFTTIPSMINR